MGITNLNKVLAPYIVRAQPKALNAVIVDGNNIMYILSARIRKQLASTFIDIKEFGKTEPIAIYRALNDAALLAVSSFMQYVSSFSMNMVFVFDGKGAANGFRTYKLEEEAKRKESKDRTLLRAIDPYGLTSYKNFMEIVTAYTGLTDNDSQYRSERDFVKKNIDVSSELDENMKYLTNIAMLHSPDFTINLVKSKLIDTEKLGVTIIDSGDDEADWVIVREARLAVPSLIISADTDIFAFAGSLDRIYMLDPKASNGDPIDVKATWDKASALMSHKPKVMIKILMMMYGCDFTAHKGAYTSCTFEDLNRIIKAGGDSMILLRNLAPRSSIGKSMIPSNGLKNIYEYLLAFHGEDGDAVDIVVDHAFDVIFSNKQNGELDKTPAG